MCINNLKAEKKKKDKNQRHKIILKLFSMLSHSESNLTSILFPATAISFSSSAILQGWNPQIKQTFFCFSIFEYTIPSAWKEFLLLTHQTHEIHQYIGYLFYEALP